MFPRSCGRCFSLGSFWAALMEPVLTFPPPSPGWPGYDINDDAKMYMQAMVFMIWILGLGLSLWENYRNTLMALL